MVSLGGEEKNNSVKQSSIYNCWCQNIITSREGDIVTFMHRSNIYVPTYETVLSLGILILDDEA